MLPWAKSSGSKIDINKAREILDEDHYELKKVKDRILDYLSVLELKPDMKGPILCFCRTSRVWARPRWADLDCARPGTQEVQACLNLGGGVRDGWIRGHRRYIPTSRCFARPDHSEHPPGGNQRPGHHAR